MRTTMFFTHLASLSWATVSIVCLYSALSSIAMGAERPPNLIIIYADDLGWGDLACYGHPTIRTPNLDRMAAEGMRFTNFYSAAEVCTPSRAALLTGRYPVRSGMCHDQFRVLRNNSKRGLPKQETTLAELVQRSGYMTACIGKWHLGHLPEHLPPQHGFAHYFGLPYSNDMRPAADSPKGRERFFEENNAYWQTPLIRGTEIIEAHPDQRMLTRRYTEEAVKFVESNSQQSFFLYVAHTFPHVPLFASDTFRGKSSAGLYGDVIEELDWSVGQILDSLKRAGIDESTMVMFSSDNGPWLIFDQHGGSAGPLREGKGSTWEGGMRVPGIFRWPGKIPAGVTQREVASTLDIVPTMSRLLGVDLEQSYDGVDIAPLLTNSGKVDRAPFLYYRGTQLYAARHGDWKIHMQTRSAYGTDKAVVHDPPQLYHLGIDPGERFNVADKHPQVVATLQAAVKQTAGQIEHGESQLE
jgi:arylsulfatase A